MADGEKKVSCVLCNRSEETKITGPLSTQDEVTAHQNCLLFSSGLYCRNSPQSDDLFGFSVEDVLDEVKRGSKLMCSRCRTKGATAGCEVGRCKRCYHFPCAFQERAKVVEDPDQGRYALFCFNHYPKIQEKSRKEQLCNGYPSSLTKSQSSKSPSEAGSSKVYCLVCEKKEGNIRLENLSNSKLYCDKHAPASQKKKHSAVRQPSVNSSDSNSSSSAKRSSSKRPFSSDDKQEETPSNHKSKSCRKIISDDSSNSDKNDSEMTMFAPLEMDVDESANSVPQSPQLIRKDTESPTVSVSGNQQDGNNDEDETLIHSDAESESLLVPLSQSVSKTKAAVSTPFRPATLPSLVLTKVAPREYDGSRAEKGPDNSPDQRSVPQQSSAGPPPSKPGSVTGSAISPDPSESICVCVCVSNLSPPSSPVVPPSDPEPSIDSTSFWKSCNAAGCTQAIFTGFINEMNNISSRIQSDQASQEDYDLALKMMMDSGKLTDLVAQQQEELQRKQRELQQATAAMKKVVLALRR